MAAWWESLPELIRVLYCIAIPSTLLLVLQTVLMLFSFGGGGAETNISDTSGLDLDADVDIDVDAGADMDAAGDAVSSDFGTLRLFTLQGIVAFLTTFSWVSICFVNGGLHPALSLVLGVVCGFAMMYAVAKLLQLSVRLTENGTKNLKDLIGENAQVYVIIPPRGEQGGKVTMTVASGFLELSAITYGKEPILAGSMVRVVDLVGDTLVVEQETMQ